jgi:glutamate carboxypeptidase
MTEKKIDALIKTLNEKALGDLTRLVDTNSFSQNTQGLIKAGNLVRDIAANKGLLLDKVYFENRPKGPFHLVADFSKDRPFTGLIGHFDTVHPPDSPFNRFEDKTDTLTGPGIQDMKSGIIVAIYGLYIAGQIMGQDKIPVKIVFNADEEIGSSDSRALIERMMEGARAAMIFEGRRLPGKALITGRKGIMMGQTTIKGKAAHAGEAPEQGASAILEAAAKIRALDKLKDPEKGVLVTTGLITGGRVANQVPDLCRFTTDIRFAQKDQEHGIREAVRQIMEQEHIPGCTTEYCLETARPPFEKTGPGQALFKEYAHAAAGFGLCFDQCSCGGGSDGNFTSSMGIPTLDGLGAAGDFPHTDDEYIEKTSFFDAIKVLALFLTQRSKP